MGLNCLDVKEQQNKLSKAVYLPGCWVDVHVVVSRSVLWLESLLPIVLFLPSVLHGACFICLLDGILS